MDSTQTPTAGAPAGSPTAGALAAGAGGAGVGAPTVGAPTVGAPTVGAGALASPTEDSEYQKFLNYFNQLKDDQEFIEEVREAEEEHDARMAELTTLPPHEQIQRHLEDSHQVGRELAAYREDQLAAARAAARKKRNLMMLVLSLLVLVLVILLEILLDYSERYM